MSHSKKTEEIDDHSVTTNKHEPKQRGGRRNKKKLTNDEIIQMLYE